jgi:hypothetical protein
LVIDWDLECHWCLSIGQRLAPARHRCRAIEQRPKIPPQILILAKKEGQPAERKPVDHWEASALVDARRNVPPVRKAPAQSDFAIDAIDLLDQLFPPVCREV